MRGTPQPGAPRGYGEGKTAVHEVGYVPLSPKRNHSQGVMG